MNNRRRKRIRKAVAEEAARVAGLTMILEADDVGDAFATPEDESEAPPLTFDSATVPAPPPDDDEDFTPTPAPTAQDRVRDENDDEEE